MPSFLAVPAITSSTARTGPPELITRVDSGSVFSAMLTNPSVPANEDHVERNIGVLHPHRDRLLAMKVEQHAAPFRQFSPIHEAAGALLVVDRELHRKGVDAGLAGNLDGFVGGGGEPQAGRGGQNNKPRQADSARANHVETSEKREVSGKLDRAAPLRAALRPPSSLWVRVRSGPERSGRGAARRCRSAAASPCERRCPGCPRPA